MRSAMNVPYRKTEPGKAGGGGAAGGGAKAQIPTGGGAALSKELQAKLGPQLGGDLSGVKIHTGAGSAKAAAEMNAEAFTVGKDIHFGAGKYQPETAAGKKLLAHELTHTLQQGGGGGHGAMEGGHEVSHPEEPAEKEAEASAEKASAKSDEEPKGGSAAAEPAASAGGAPKAAPSPSAKLDGVGRKAYRALANVPISDRYNTGAGPNPSATAGANVGGASMAENPQFESDAAAFEVKLGGVAFGLGAAAGAALCAKARAYIESKVPADDFKTLGTATQELLKKCGEAKTSFAGAVGNDPAIVQQLLLTATELDAKVRAAGTDAAKLKAVPQPANLREQMTFIYNFANNILTPDILTTDKSQIPAMVAKAQLDDKKIMERKAFIEKQAKDRNANGKARPGSDGKSAWDAVGMVPRPADPSNVVGGKAGKAGKTAQAVSSQWSARANRNEAETSAKKPKSSDISTRTAADAQAQGAGLSDRESSHMGILSGDDTLKWSEGAKMWIINERDKWVKAMRALSLPLAAGPSGTTNVLMNSGAMLGGTSPVDVRLACIGYLLPIRAHSLVEVMAAAAAHGVPFTVGKKMYHDVKPLAEDQLRGCGRTGGHDGKALFPDEPSPAAATAAPAPGAAGAGPHHG